MEAQDSSIPRARASWAWILGPTVTGRAVKEEGTSEGPYIPLPEGARPCGVGQHAASLVAGCQPSALPNSALGAP